MPDETALQHRLIRALLDPVAYPHAVAQVEHIETHISHILLAGEHAYKIKKPLDLGFLNYRGLQTRRHYCFEELRLNRRTAPDIYLDVVGVAGSPEMPRIVSDARDDCLEYAVHMRRFPADALLSERVAAERLSGPLIDDLAEQIAAFHQGAHKAQSDTEWGLPHKVHQPVINNFKVLAGQCDAERIQALRGWSEEAARRLQTRFQRRREAGMIRECHGDLHLGNIIMWQGRPCLFDGIEFNDALRWIDLINDIAFLVMDLEERKHAGEAWRLLNRYLEFTGDYDGLALLNYYRNYRALVRAKVAAIRLQQTDLDPAERADEESQLDAYLSLAESYTRAGSPFLLLTSGLSGSGKTWISQELLQGLGLIRLRSDVERKRLFGLGPLERSESALDSGIYTPEAGRRTYQRLHQLADGVLAAGHPVIVDATFLDRSHRSRFLALAGRHGVPALVLRCEADEAVLRERILQRDSAGKDASEAGLLVLQKQLGHWHAPDVGETANTLVIDTGQTLNPQALIRRVSERVGLTV